MLIIRRYLQHRFGIPGVLALAASALLAGCGAGGGATTTATTPAAPAPVVSGGGVQDAAGTGGSGGSGQAAGTVSGGGAAGRFSTAKTGSFGHASPSYGSARAQYGHAPAGSVLTGSQAHPSATPAPPRSTPPAPTPPKRVAPTPPHRAPSHPIIHTRTVIVYVTRVKLHNVYRTRTVTRTVTKTKNPNVPAGAYLPSTHPVLAQSSFTVAGGNVGCQISRGTVRCGVVHRTWAPPVQPGSCRSTWGDTIALAPTGLPQFACGGSNPVDPAAKVIPSGYDDTVGEITCQVRTFGVDCFNAKSRSGFMLSRTGYARY